VILGAGMSGLCMAVQLKRAGIEDFVVIEQQPGLGGTWWDNRYPGAHVDVPAPLYSFSFAPNPNWQRRFAAAPEIQATCSASRSSRRAAARPLRHPHHRGGVRRRARPLAHHHAGGPALSARFFVCSTGPLNQPRWPDIPGLADFRGQRLHSARWDAAVPLRGRRIGVIGTGSTASQLIPPLADQAAALHVFQRTANWVLPRLDRRYTRSTARWRSCRRTPPRCARSGTRAGGRPARVRRRDAACGGR